MALSEKATRQFVGHTQRVAGKAAASDTYYPGGMLVFDADGYMAVPSDTADLPPAGVYTGHGIDPGDSALETGIGENPDIEVERGLAWIPYSGASQSDVGTPFYVADDNVLTTTAGSKNWQVLAVAYKSGYLLVDFAHPMKA